MIDWPSAIAAGSKWRCIWGSNVFHLGNKKTLFRNLVCQGWSLLQKGRWKSSSGKPFHNKALLSDELAWLGGKVTCYLNTEASKQFSLTGTFHVLDQSTPELFLQVWGPVKEGRISAKAAWSWYSSHSTVKLDWGRTWSISEMVPLAMGRAALPPQGRLLWPV